jgi:diacylglycerol kinase family enzyme
MVFNAAQVAIAGIPVGPGVNPHDGMLDVALLRSSKASSILASLYRLLTGKLKQEGRRPEHLRAKKISITSTQPQEVQADGDLLGVDGLVIELLPYAITLSVAQEYRTLNDVIK